LNRLKNFTTSPITEKAKANQLTTINTGDTQIPISEESKQTNKVLPAETNSNLSVGK
jgi:hypothetical protein